MMFVYTEVLQHTYRLLDSIHRVPPSTNFNVTNKFCKGDA